MLVLTGENIGKRSVTVDHAATCEQPVTLSVEEPGRRRLRSLFYKGAAVVEPSRHLRRWVEVRG